MASQATLADRRAAVAHGWFGTESGGLMPTHVLFGRVAG